VASLVNMIWPSGTTSFIFSAAGAPIFSGLIACDTQKIKEQYAEASGTEMAGKLGILFVPRRCSPMAALPLRRPEASEFRDPGLASHGRAPSPEDLPITD
jgi:FtsH-binding integral membrane protein